MDQKLEPGLSLFNQGHFWHAHEAWETAWREQGAGPLAGLYRGLICHAAALFHLRRGNLPGGVRLLGRSAGYLEPYRPAALGLDLEAVEAAQRELRRLAEQGVRPDLCLDRIPRLRQGQDQGAGRGNTGRRGGTKMPELGEAPEPARKELEVWRALAGACRRIASEPTLSATLAAIAEEGRRVLGADRCAIYVRDPQERLHCPYSYGLSQEYVEKVRQHYQRMPGMGLAEHPAIFIEDIETLGPEYEDFRQAARREGFRALALLRMDYAGTGFGALAFYHDQPRAYDPVMREIAMAFADHVALAATQARLIEQLQETNRRLARLNEELECRVRERTRELEEAQKERMRFVAGVTHDLRAPLNAVLGFTSTLLEDPQVREEERIKFLSHIRRAGDQILHLIDDLVDLSSLQAGRLELNLQSFEARPVLEEVLALVEGEARGRGVTVRLEEGTVGTVQADPRRFRQILINLLLNAIKFSPPGSEVVVSGQRGPGWVRFCVADRGPGIPPEERENIFRAYYRSSQVTPGAGLGLSISRSLAELHGGRLWVEDNPGGGSRFYLELPDPGTSAADS
ncbi:MAG TPA: DUF309 domain-containing protein [Candidatus Nitrosotenuis sp.]|jgi:signal transduction histidine kinase/predicted metal-dependent hydrolase|nr:DUF309 domain-containing protein [Candidatus Nitrosotenuis sp.]